MASRDGGGSVGAHRPAEIQVCPQLTPFFHLSCRLDASRASETNMLTTIRFEQLRLRGLIQRVHGTVSLSPVGPEAARLATAAPRRYNWSQTMASSNISRLGMRVAAIERHTGAAANNGSM
jgi:hypothetical protein